VAELKIIFMGTAELSCPSLELLVAQASSLPVDRLDACATHFHVAAVVTQPDKPKGRDLKLTPSPVKVLAQKLNLPVLQPAKARDENFIARLRELKPDLIVVAAYGQILPQAILDLPPHGCLNVHPSLLPKYRGAAPIQWAIANGDTETGVAIMKMDAGLDTGPVLAVRRTPILPADDSLILHDRLAQLGAAGAPGLLAHDGPRVLLDDSPGADCYGATGQRLLAMVELLVGLQTAWVGRVGELVGLGATDFRAQALTGAAVDAYHRTAAELDGSIRPVLEALLARLDDRFAAVAACGVPDTLVHGDFHPGNLVGGTSGAPLVLLDWGDCGAGHPLLDQAAFTGRLGAADLAAVRATWARLWRDAVPGSEPERAARLLAPIAALRQATVYRMFLDHIEPSERIYHETDPALWLREAARLAAGEGTT